MVKAQRLLAGGAVVVAAVLGSATLCACFEARWDCDRNPLLECGRFSPDVWHGAAGHGGAQTSPVPGFAGAAGQAGGGQAGSGGNGATGGAGGAGGAGTAGGSGGSGGLGSSGGSGGVGG